MSIIVENDPLDQVDGSASFEFGAIKVMSSVTGPIEAARPRNELPTKAYLDINIRPSFGVPSTRETLLEHKLGQLLPAVINLDQYPRQTIQIAVQILKNGEPNDYTARQLVAIINSVFIALINSGISLKSSLMATCCSISAEGEIRTSPTSSELASSVSHFVVVYSIEDQQIDNLLFCDGLGTFKQQQLFDVLDRAASEILLNFQQIRQAIASHVSQNYVWKA
ncbi:hypothetical protein KL947_000901 [Ogataea haglerorum]|nr:hypothetical protein KL947_000901 [Ogataea haglerorum]